MSDFIFKNSRVISVAAIGLAIVLGAWLFKNAYADYQILNAPKPQSSINSAQNAQPRRQVDVNKIVQAHLFGDPNKPAAPKPVAKPKPKPAPETKLNVNLIGLVGSNNGKVARAIIKLNRGQPEVVGVGDKLGQTGAVVNAILSNEMIIERAGVKESVKLTERKKRLQALAMKQPNDNSQGLFQRSEQEPPAGLPEASEDVFGIDAPPMPMPGGFGDMPFEAEFDDEFAGEFPEGFPEDLIQDPPISEEELRQLNEPGAF